MGEKKITAFVVHLAETQMWSIDVTCHRHIDAKSYEKKIMDTARA